MKLAQSLALIITGSASFFIPFALANLHIAMVVDQKNQSVLIACASSNYNCDCFQKGNGAAEVSLGGMQVSSLPESAFTVESGLCGSRLPNLKYNFYYNQRNGNWDFYKKDGDGKSLGTCYYSNTAGASLSCSITYVYDQLVCYTNICSHSNA